MQGFKTVTLLCAVAAFACLHACSAEEEPSAPAQYEFAYAVNDPVTGDQKEQREARNGDDVTGYYRLVDADGYLRTVRYKSDAVNGFTADVVREPVNGGAVVPASPVVQKAAVVPVKPAAPIASPAPYYFGSASPYPYAGYQPYPYAGYQPYPYAGYQPYPYAGYQSYPYAGYQPYSYGRYSYSSQYPYNSQYPFSSTYALRK